MQNGLQTPGDPISAASLSAASPKPDHIQGVLIEEYRSLWSYYSKTLDERGRIFEIYFKVVSVPFVLTGGIVFFLKPTADENADVVEIIQRLDAVIGGAALFFILAFVAGLACYVYYCLESANSRIYLIALTAIRNKWRADMSLHRDIIVDLLRPELKFTGDLIAHARGATFVVFNSAMITACTWLLVRSGMTLIPNVPEVAVALSLATLIAAGSLHLAIGKFALDNYAKSDDNKLMRSKVALERATHLATAKGDSENEDSGGNRKP